MFGTSLLKEEREAVGEIHYRVMKEEEYLGQSSDRLSLRRTAGFFHGDSYHL